MGRTSPCLQQKVTCPEQVGRLCSHHFPLLFRHHAPLASTDLLSTLPYKDPPFTTQAVEGLDSAGFRSHQAL